MSSHGSGGCVTKTEWSSYTKKNANAGGTTRLHSNIYDSKISDLILIEPTSKILKPEIGDSCSAGG